MKSIRTKILILILGCVVISTAAVVVVNVTNVGKRMEEDAFRILKLQCQEKEHLLNETLLNVEQGVNTIYQYVISTMPDVDILWDDVELRREYLDDVQEVSLIAAENTEGAVAVYFRINPDLVENNVAGTFMVKNQGEFKPFELTDISLYEKDDVEHVGWYYIPLEKKEPTWIEPYNNLNVEMSMISYVIPVYVDGVTIGVIGMDIEMHLLHEKVDSVNIYETGYAFLMNSAGEIISHEGCPHGTIKEEVAGDMDRVREKVFDSALNNEIASYKWAGEDKFLVSEKLSNGMYFTVCVPKSEIDAPRNNMYNYSIASMSIILIIFIVITIVLTGAIVRPLKELTQKAEKVAASDLEVDFTCKSKDEVGVLSDSLSKMVLSLNNKMEQINDMAFWDVLTGLRSNAAYNLTIEEIDRQIKSGRAEFSVFIMDVNNLKKMNDTYGHRMGDVMLKDSADVMRKVWNEDSIYRVGGDEFVVVLKNSVSAQYQDDVKTFNHELEKFNKANDKYDMELRIAIGMAVYNRGRDENFVDVFRRADTLMYEDKHKKKQK